MRVRRGGGAFPSAIARAREYLPETHCRQLAYCRAQQAFLQKIPHDTALNFLSSARLAGSISERLRGGSSVATCSASLA